MTRWQANALLLAVAAIWGSAFVAQNLAMAHMGPMGFTGVRFLVGAVVVAPLAWREWKYLRSRGLRHTGEDVVHVLGLGLLLWGGAALQQIGIQGTTVTNAGFLTALYVPLMPLLAWVRTGRAPHAWLWPASIGCVVGTWLLSGAGSVAFHPGDLWVLASVLPWALHVLFVGEVAERMAAPFMVACGQFLACSAASLLWAGVAEPMTVSALVAAAPAIAYTGVLSVGVGFTAQVVAQRCTAPADAAIVLSSETLFAALFGYALMGDRLTAAGWAGAALIFSCMLAVQLLALRQPARSAIAPVLPARAAAQNE